MIKSDVNANLIVFTRTSLISKVVGKENKVLLKEIDKT